MNDYEPRVGDLLVNRWSAAYWSVTKTWPDDGPRPASARLLCVHDERDGEEELTRSPTVGYILSHYQLAHRVAQ